MFENKDVFIFDLDGTLLDSLSVWNEVDLALIRELGGPKEAEQHIQERREQLLAQFSKLPDPYAAYCAYLGNISNSPLSGEEIKDIRYEIASQFLRERVTFKPGAVEFIEKLKKAGKTLCIATTTKRSNVNIYANHNPHVGGKIAFDDTFALIYTREDVSAIKPDPEVYVKTVKTLGADPSSCIVFEDSLSGVRAAAAAGLDTIVMADPFSDKDRAEIEKLSDRHADSFFDFL
jgi:beta-phosphoglucomutase-like phosphatase (HAD superfamily)